MIGAVVKAFLRGFRAGAREGQPEKPDDRLKVPSVKPPKPWPRL